MFATFLLTNFAQKHDPILLNKGPCTYDVRTEGGGGFNNHQIVLVRVRSSVSVALFFLALTKSKRRRPCTYDVRTEGGGGIEELPNFADMQY